MVDERTSVLGWAGQLVCLTLMRFLFAVCIMLVFSSRGELTVSSPLFIVFLYQNKLRFHFAKRRTIDKAFWYLQKHLSWMWSGLQKSPSTRSFTLRKLECFKQAVKRFLILLVANNHSVIWEIAFWILLAWDKKHRLCSCLVGFFKDFKISGGIIRASVLLFFCFPGYRVID